jgi:hypothetical protein
MSEQPIAPPEDVQLPAEVADPQFDDAGDGDEHKAEHKPEDDE